MRHGTGKFYYTDGGLYDGEWRENKMSGHGKLYYQSGKIAYDGNWSDDKFTGFGVLYNEVPLPMESTLDYSNFEQVDEYWTRFEGILFSYFRVVLRRLEAGARSPLPEQRLILRRRVRQGHCDGSGLLPSPQRRKRARHMEPKHVCPASKLMSRFVNNFLLTHPVIRLKRGNSSMGANPPR